MTMQRLMPTLLTVLLLILAPGSWAAGEASRDEASFPVVEKSVSADSISVTDATESNAEATSPSGRKSLAQNEQDIPVELDNKAVSRDSGSSLGRLFLVFAVIVGFAMLAYVGLKKYRFKNQKTSQFEMKILAQHHLGPKKSLAVVRVAGESILIGVTDHHISAIKSLALLDEDLPSVSSADMKGGFEGVLKTQADESEDFAISKIRDVVSRQVRNLKSLE